MGRSSEDAGNCPIRGLRLVRLFHRRHDRITQTSRPLARSDTPKDRAPSGSLAQNRPPQGSQLGARKWASNPDPQISGATRAIGPVPSPAESGDQTPSLWARRPAPSCRHPWCHLTVNSQISAQKWSRPFLADIIATEHFGSPNNRRAASSRTRPTLPWQRWTHCDRVGTRIWPNGWSAQRENRLKRRCTHLEPAFVATIGSAAVNMTCEALPWAVKPSFRGCLGVLPGNCSKSRWGKTFSAPRWISIST